MEDFFIGLLQDHPLFLALCGIAFVIILSIFLPYLGAAFLVLIFLWGALEGML